MVDAQNWENVLLLGPDFVIPDYYAPEFLPGYGDWETDYPLTNLLKPRRLTYAKSTSGDEDDAEFVIDLKALRDIKGISIPWAIWEETDKLSAYFYADEGLTDLRGSVENSEVYREVYPIETTDFESEEFNTGKISEEDRAKFPVPWFEFFEDKIIARYVRVRLHRDSSNPWIINRIHAADGIQPRINMSANGSGMGVTDASVTTIKLGGARVSDPREKRRSMTLSFEEVEEDEAMNFLDFFYRLGTTRQGFVSWNPGATLHRHRQSYLFTIEQLGDLDAASAFRYSTSFKLTEEVA